MNSSAQIEQHYSFAGLLERVQTALELAGRGSVDWSQLASFDQFHVRGVPATRELAEGLNLAAGAQVLDLGSGLGGPARYLAANYLCQVTGIELTPPYVEVANLLSERAGLTARTRFIRGDATRLPFREDEFDAAFTQHVAMNIEDKNTFYREVYRVIKAAGRFGSYDAVRGEAEPVIYPVPWAREARLSFLAGANEMTDALGSAGFRILSSVDRTKEGIAWFQELSAQGSQPATSVPGAVNPGTVFGPFFREATANFARNLRENRVRLVQVIAEKK